MFMTAAESFPKLRDHENDVSKKLMAFGCGRFNDFLAERDSRLLPYLGL